MIKKVAIVVGSVFALVGLLGFIPALTPAGSDGMPLLLGLFMVGVVHNLIHLLSGIAGIVAGYTSAKWARLYFRIFGIVYGIVTIIGFLQGTTVLGIISVNLADNLLHLVLTVLLLSIGFGLPRSNEEHTAAIA